MCMAIGKRADSVRFWGTLSWIVTAIDPALRRIGGNSFVCADFNHVWRKQALEING